MNANGVCYCLLSHLKWKKEVKIFKNPIVLFLSCLQIYMFIFRSNLNTKRRPFRKMWKTLSSFSLFLLLFRCFSKPYLALRGCSFTRKSNACYDAFPFPYRHLFANFELILICTTQKWVALAFFDCLSDRWLTRISGLLCSFWKGGSVFVYFRDLITLNGRFAIRYW